MAFWIAISARSVSGSSTGNSFWVVEPSYTSMESAAAALVDTTPPVVTGTVTEANAYIVEAITWREASDLMLALLVDHAHPEHVHLVRQGIQTRPAVTGDPHRELLGQVLGELSISHQLTESALAHSSSREHDSLLVRIAGELAQFSSEVIGLLNEIDPGARTEQTPEKQLGYRAASLEGDPPADSAAALESLMCEISIGRRLIERAMNSARPNQNLRLREIAKSLATFEGDLSTMRRTV